MRPISVAAKARECGQGHENDVHVHSDGRFRHRMFDQAPHVSRPSSTSFLFAGFHTNTHVHSDGRFKHAQSLARYRMFDQASHVSRPPSSTSFCLRGSARTYMSIPTTVSDMHSRLHVTEYPPKRHTYPVPSSTPREYACPFRQPFLTCTGSSHVTECSTTRRLTFSSARLSSTDYQAWHVRPTLNEHAQPFLADFERRATFERNERH